MLAANACAPDSHCPAQLWANNQFNRLRSRIRRPVSLQSTVSQSLRSAAVGNSGTKIAILSRVFLLQSSSRTVETCSRRQSHGASHLVGNERTGAQCCAVELCAADNGRYRASIEVFGLKPWRHRRCQLSEAQSYRDGLGIAERLATPGSGGMSITERRRL